MGNDTQASDNRCKGTNCTARRGDNESAHSHECQIEYARTTRGDFPTRWKHLESGRIVTDVKESFSRIGSLEWISAVSYTVETGVQYTRDKATFLAKFTPVQEATQAEGIRFANVDGQTTIYDFKGNQWWMDELEKIVDEFHTARGLLSPDQVRAVAVVRHLLKLISELPDIDALKEQSEAWFKVMETLRQVHPAFMYETNTVRSGLDTAIGAIRDLAKDRPPLFDIQPPPPGPGLKPTTQDVRDFVGLKATVVPGHPKNVVSFVDMQTGKLMGSVILADPESITTAAPARNIDAAFLHTSDPERV